MTKRPPATKPEGLLLTDLKPGHIYLDVLSHLPTLVEIQSVTGPAEGDPRKETTTVLVRGLYYNPAYGVHQRVALVDRQLTHMPGTPGEK
jgi:hypothetical protein